MKRWAGHAAYMEETRNTRKLLIGTDNLGEKVVDETIILRFIWWEYNVCGLDLSVLQSILMLRIVEHGNVSSNSAERGEYFNWLNDYWFFKNSTPRSWFLINNNSEEIVINVQRGADPTLHCSVSFKRISQLNIAISSAILAVSGYGTELSG